MLVSRNHFQMSFKTLKSSISEVHYSMQFQVDKTSAESNFLFFLKMFDASSYLWESSIRHFLGWTALRISANRICLPRHFSSFLEPLPKAISFGNRNAADFRPFEAPWVFEAAENQGLNWSSRRFPNWDIRAFACRWMRFEVILFKVMIGCE